MTPLEQALAGPLRALTDFPQFVLYALEPMADGKTRKFPIDPATGRPADGQDPRNWMTAEQAMADGRPVGFVFTEADPFFFLDIDNALQADNTWSALAQDLCARLAGCAVEVSQSGRGLHVIGRAAPVEHAKRSQPLGLELYTSRRFVALTGSGAQGDAGRDASAALHALVAEHFPPGAEASGEYEEGPRPEWRGPTDDDDLIRRALRSQSAAAIFGNKASFADLWHAEPEALARAFPGDREAWDGSAADAALAAHLAFWTGCDGPRIERLMRRSALVRDKWDRLDYLPRTIASACPPGRAVCQDREPEPATDADASPRPERPAGAPSKPPRGALLDGPGMAALFHGCVYVRGQHRVYVPGRGVLRPDAFSAEFGGYQFLMKEGTEGAGAIKSDAFSALVNSARYECAKCDMPAFDPTRQPGEVFEQDGILVVNTYQPAAVSRSDGDVQPLLDHVGRLLPTGRDAEILLSWMAAVVQYPGRKFLWSPVVTGGKGDGKSILFEKLLTAAVGPQFCNVVKPAQMVGKHATWMLNHIFSLCDDVGKHVTEEWLDEVKTLITGPRQLVEPKGVDTFMARVCTNIAFTSNHKRAIRVTPDERRFAVLWCQSPEPVDVAAFAKWTDDPANLHAVAGFLTRYQIPAELNPLHVKNAPHTSSMAEAVSGSGDRIDQILEDAIAEAAQGFRGGLIAMQAFEALLESKGVRGITRTVRVDALERAGYVPHPNARSQGDGWTSNPVAEAGGKKLRLFVKRGHPAESLPTGAAVVRHYVDNLTTPVNFGADYKISAPA